jgi:hypothetical protein
MIPPDSSFKKSQDGAFQATGFVFYSMYKQGVLGSIEVSSGSWTKVNGEATYSSTPGGDSAEANISDTEVLFSYVFDNLSNTKTTYSIRIRRSTLRFVEDYQWTTSPKDKTADVDSSAGYCKTFAKSTSS